MKYRKEIDGLRAIAVMTVIFFHAGFEAFSGGFVGVDVFFVISGYLITTIILAELEQGKFQIISFYERRARRILPALFFVMLACIPLALFCLLPGDMKGFSKSLIAVPLFISNILFWHESGYFETAAELKPLLHTWSLALEEQYYILFPIFLMLFWKLDKRYIYILVTIGLVFLTSLAIAQWAAYTKPVAAFYLLPSRAWELLIGVFTAFYLSKINRKKFDKVLCERGGLLGIALIFYSVFKYNRETPFPGFYALTPTLGTALIILFASQQTIVGKFLGNKVCVGIGTISYSAYLWHQPLFAFAKQNSMFEPTHIILLLLSILTLVLAYFSYRLVETPFRDKHRFKRKTVFISSLIFSSFFIILGFVGYFNQSNFESWWLTRIPTKQIEFYKRLISKDSKLDNFGAKENGDQNLSQCRFNVSKLDPSISLRIKACLESYGPGILILGDSHAIDLFGVVTSRFKDDFIIGVTNGGCRPHTPRAECQYDSVLKFVNENPKIFSHVIYEQAGFYLLLDKDGKKGSRDMFSNLAYYDRVDDKKIDYEHLNATFSYLRDLAKIVSVTWFLPRIEHHISTQFILKHGCEFSYAFRPNLVNVFLRLDKTIEDLIYNSKVKNIKSISQNDVYGFNFANDLLNCKEIYWTDGDHFSSQGEVRFGKRLPQNFLR